jgi:hypothetical protein
MGHSDAFWSERTLQSRRVQKTGCSGSDLLIQGFGVHGGRNSTNASEEMERETRLELATPTLARLCSTN